jgi:hypothetical protein
MRFAYADPPYLGCGAKHYAKHHGAAADYDRIETHAALIQRLCDEFPDGWALSLHEPSLRRLLPLCPEDCRVSPWVKPFASFKPGVNPGYAWEPVIWRGGRKMGRDVDTVRDYVSCHITLQRGLTGAKPDRFCFWLFELLGMYPDDEFVDLFPGSGAVGRAWDAWRGQTRLFGGAA